MKMECGKIFLSQSSEAQRLSNPLFYLLPTPIPEASQVHFRKRMPPNEENGGDVDGHLKASVPHEALFHALGYLRLEELFRVRLVCRSLRDAVNSDPLLWRHIVLEPSLSWKVTDFLLLEMASKANGMLASLVLVDCINLSDDALYTLALSNPHITRLHIPGCTRLTPGGVVRVVESLSNLKHLRVYGLLNTNKEHLDRLNSLLHVNPQRRMVFYNGWYSTSSGVSDHPIDVDMCPSCNNVRMVFDCPREECQQRWLPCRGCFFCIARCGECGGCVSPEDMAGGETICLDFLCMECWLRLPKCLLCNKASCSRHVYLQSRSNSSGFTCDNCLL